MALPPVDQLNFAELVQRFQLLIDAQQAALLQVPVAERSGPGPFDLSVAFEAGKRIRVGNGGASATIVLNLPNNAPVGTVFMPRQTTVAPLKFIPQAGATLVPFQAGHNGSGGINSVALLTCEANSDGNSAVWHLDGITGAVA